jgi:hypothetical protein
MLRVIVFIHFIIDLSVLKKCLKNTTKMTKVDKSAPSLPNKPTVDSKLTNSVMHIFFLLFVLQMMNSITRSAFIFLCEKKNNKIQRTSLWRSLVVLCPKFEVNRPTLSKKCLKNITKMTKVDKSAPSLPDKPTVDSKLTNSVMHIFFLLFVLQMLLILGSQ